VVATLLPPNIPAQPKRISARPLAGAVLNTKLTPAGLWRSVAAISDPRRMRGCFAGYPVHDLAEAACLPNWTGLPPLLIEVPDAGFAAHRASSTYEDFIAQGDPVRMGIASGTIWESLASELYSGTTGRPKGVVWSYHHRGAYLMTMGHVVELSAWF